MSATQVKVNGTDGHGMGGESSESDAPEVAVEAAPEAPKKRRGRPKKSAVDVLDPHGLSRDVAVIDPRQLGMLAGDSTPEAVSVATLLVVFSELDGELSRRQQRHERDAADLAAVARDIRGSEMIADLLGRAREQFALAVAIGDVRKAVRRTLGGLGVR